MGISAYKEVTEWNNPDFRVPSHTYLFDSKSNALAYAKESNDELVILHKPLAVDTRQQKFFNIIGPRRSGKGTINKILVSLLGQHNTVAPQLEELCDTFGLQPWLGKLLASFTDARAPERNRSAVVSQLLRIVGGDTVTVNRKNKEAWSGYLPTRIVVYSNEVLQLTDE
jgi:phage/plasmid-associated DNA primase